MSRNVAESHFGMTSDVTEGFPDGWENSEDEGSGWLATRRVTKYGAGAVNGGAPVAVVQEMTVEPVVPDMPAAGDFDTQIFCTFLVEACVLSPSAPFMEWAYFKGIERGRLFG